MKKFRKIMVNSYNLVDKNLYNFLFNNKGLEIWY